MFITIISLVAVAIFLLSLDLSWTNLVSVSRNNVVFEGRNMSYGAYALRKEHHTNLLFALLISVGLIGGGFLAISALRSKPIALPVPSSVVVDIPVPAQKRVAEVKKPDQNQAKKEPRQTNASAPKAVTTIEVVERGAASVAVSAAGGAKGGDGDTGEIQQPVLAGDDGGNGSDGSGSVVVEKKKPRRGVRNMPKFPGGDEALMEYMHRRVRYSDYEIERNVSGTMYITFVILDDGSIGDIFIEREIKNGERLAKRAIEAIGEMPSWTPGNDGSEPLPVFVTMPLKFELRN